MISKYTLILKTTVIKAGLRPSPSKVASEWHSPTWNPDQWPEARSLLDVHTHPTQPRASCKTRK